MQNFIITLLICSVAMSALALLYMAATPLLAKRYSEKGRYYAWLIIIAGLIIPFRPQLDFALFRVEVPSNVPLVVQVNGEVPSYLFPPIDLSFLPTVENVVTSETTLNISWWQIAAAVWLAGALLFIAYHGIKHYRFIKVARRWSENITDGQILSLFENLKIEMGIRRQIPIYLCPFAGSPLMIGLFKPRIFLPTVELAQDELCFIIQHELVHYKRKDLLYKYLVLVVTALHWFNPVIHLMAKAVNVLCETSCDAEVLQSADDNTRLLYGETIISVVEYQSKLKTALSTNFYGGKQGMTKRISSIMDTRKKKTGVIIACLVLVLTMSTGLVFAATGSTTETDNNLIVFNVAEADSATEVNSNLHIDNTAIADSTASVSPTNYSLFNAEALIMLEQFGVTFDGVAPSDDGRLVMRESQTIYYNGQLVRLFADVGGGTWMTSAEPGGLVDVHVLRDDNGSITGVNVVSANEPITINQ